MAQSKAQKITFTIWMKLGIAAIAVRLLFAVFPKLCETFYSRGLFPFIRTFFDNTFAYLPFPGVYIFVIVLAVWLPTVIYRLLVDIYKRQHFYQHLNAFLSFLGGLIFWFLLLWGYNYARVPMAQQLSLEVPEFLGHDEIWDEAQFIKNKCIEVRNQIPNLDTSAITDDYFPPAEELEKEMRQLVEDVLEDYGYDISGHVSGRFLKPKGVLLRFSSSGVYFPFTGEGHVDDGMPTVVKPFTLAHELGHGYGFGNEAVCNFIGYLACIRSENPAIQYSGYLMYWRYVYGELMAFMTEEDYLKERATISRGMYNDIELIYQTIDAYPPLIPYIQQTAYDIFLKAQGIEEGIESYNRVVLLVSSWRKKY